MIKPCHFWYSERLEIFSYENYAQALECGMVSMLDIPRWNTCRLSLNGESATLRYNICSENENDYAQIPDRIYLGFGTMAECRPMKHAEVIDRVRELDMIAPTVLTRPLA